MKTRIYLFYLIILGLFFLTINFIGASSTGSTNVTAEISANEVGLSVQEDLFLENVTSGYASGKGKIQINNTGNLDINVTVSLDPIYNESIFTNLEFASHSSNSDSDYKNFNDFFVRINKSTTFRDIRSKNIYARLNLKDYDKTFSQAENQSVEIIFTAMAA